MIRGLYTAASGMLSSMRRMEFVTNNLANAQTVGFKQDRSALSTFDEMMILQDGSVTPPGQHAELGELGMAAVAEEPMIDFTQGSLQDTGRSLDMALEGPGFFTVQTPDGLRYTRDGGFTRDANGRLTTGEGHLVLGMDGNPIQVPPGKLAVLADGTLTAEDEEFGQLAIVEFDLDQPLRKVGNNQFVARNEGDQPRGGHRDGGPPGRHRSLERGHGRRADDDAGAPARLPGGAAADPVPGRDGGTGGQRDRPAGQLGGRYTMWSSLRTAVSGMLAQQRALDVAADNLTKMQVPGSKSQRVSFIEMAPELTLPGRARRRGQRHRGRPRDRQGRQDLGDLQNLSQGMLLPTDNPMDIAIDGDGMLEVTPADGQTAYTHGGSLHLDGMRRLVTSTGAMVSPPIEVPEGIATLEVKPDGIVIAVSPEGDPPADRPAQAGALREPGGAPADRRERLAADCRLRRPDRGAGRRGRESGTVLTGIIESSNIDPREEYLRVVQAQRAYELNVRAHEDDGRDAPGRQQSAATVARGVT